MDLLKPPEPLHLSGNVSENWKRFKQRFELFLQATAVEKAPRSDSSKVALLLSFAGDEVLDIFNNFQYGPEESKECYDTVVQKFDAYFSEYIPGKHLVLADMLSRSTADNQDEAGATTDVEVHAIQLLGYRVTEATQKELQAATARDRYLQSVIASLSVGLPVQDSGDDFWLGLLAYRSTPLEDGRSPGELLQGRRLRANLPDFSAVTATNVKKHSQAQGGRPLPPLQKGVVVRLRDAAWSRKAQVVGSPYPRSYLVKTEDQKLLRRNRRHLLQTGERFIEESDDDIDTSPADNVGGHPTVATSTSPANGRRREVPTSGDPSPPVVRQSTPPPTPALRRSTRTVKPPQRLHYDKDFNQVSDIIF
ncbi:uncharacterized protein LOC119403985 isoform X2 [Rhipicephalus sanguineus]|uniref:uncharacterized protein LOC119403985 isoform X2 n=1 Tax=Rhipicephalus sanguineus TaxID=34632 RepID=UPI0020C3AC83|nr:uncharacterized protein LOC119403985 isoform X2 [Rhipicephalus sanguineus]